MSTFGWSYLSREALRQAEAQLAGEPSGVRDEIGFLAIHQRYADRFFPGTSVLHTRLRYALFVPWTYLRLQEQRSRTRFDTALQQAEVALAGRLLTAPGGGVIGGITYPKPTSQPPSIVYWTALGTWGVLRARSDGRLPSRAQIQALMQSRSRSSFDDDGLPLLAAEFPFAALPPPPKNWETAEALDFALTPPEASFLYSLISNLRSPSAHSHEKSLYARLAGASAVDVQSCWDPEIMALAGIDAPALGRAGDAASLAAIGRAIYAAMVETVCEDRDKREMSSLHRDHLEPTIAEHARRARRVDLRILLADHPDLPATLVDVLQQTQVWLASGAFDPMPLRSVYARAEHARKGQRARLPDTLNGRERRLEWKNEEHTLAEPLHYRWPNVLRLLKDLWAAA